MPKVTLSTVIWLIVWSLIVGLALSFLNITPLDLLTMAKEGAEQIVQRVSGSAGNAVSYVLLGAVVVVPLWLILHLLRATRAGGNKRG
ncbi:MAG: DUF6460 domain-containing protein [Geminicoccaceae bacterium]